MPRIQQSLRDYPKRLASDYQGATRAVYLAALVRDPSFAPILAGMLDDEAVIDEMVKPHPGRFMVFTQLDWSKVEDPNFGAEMAAQIRDSVSRGARGLKLLKDLGLGVRDKSGKLIAIDDPRLDPAWEECGRLGIPVFIHSGDPEAFFLPIDATNERYEELIEHPDWSFYGRDYPGLQSLLEARNRVFAKHPHTTFVSLHMGWPENLDWVQSMLDKYPNVMVEFGAREAELGRQPRRTRDLFMKYQDRVMFGTDNGSKPAMSTSLTGARPAKDASPSAAWGCRMRFWKRSTIKTPSACSGSSTQIPSAVQTRGPSEVATPSHLFSHFGCVRISSHSGVQSRPAETQRKRAAFPTLGYQGPNQSRRPAPPDYGDRQF